MRVLQVTDDLPSTPRGGLDWHVRQLNRELRQHDVESIVLKLAVGEAQRVANLDEDWSASEPGDIGRERPVTVQFGEPATDQGGLVGQILDSPVVEAFGEALDRLQPDAVHVHNLQHLSHRIVETARSRGVQTVWTMHDFFAICQRTHLRKGDGSSCDGPQSGVACGPCHAGGLKGLLASPVFALRNIGFANAMRSAHVIVAPSRFLADIIVAHGAPEERVHVLPPAVPRAARMADMASGAGGIRLIYAGDLREAKGADLCIEAMHRLDRSDLTLEIHGGSPPAPAKPEVDFEQRLRALAEGTRTTFFGRYSDPDMMQLLDGATAVIVPSRVRETFGRTANRALQLGVPVIAADHGALAEYVLDGVNGLLFPPGDVDALAKAMERIVDDGVRMQSDAPNWPEVPDLANHVEALLPLYVWRP